MAVVLITAEAPISAAVPFISAGAAVTEAVASTTMGAPFGMVVVAVDRRVISGNVRDLLLDVGEGVRERD